MLGDNHFRLPSGLEFQERAMDYIHRPFFLPWNRELSPEPRPSESYKQAYVSRCQDNRCARRSGSSGKPPDDVSGGTL